LHAQIHRARDFLNERELEVQPRLGNTFELAKPLDDGRGLLLDHKEERADGRLNAFDGSGRVRHVCLLGRIRWAAANNSRRAPR
jgi:hypothetical protein